MIDLHSHILPGVDDGPKTLEESLAMLHTAYGQGIRTLVATPHVGHPMMVHDDAKIATAYQTLSDAVKGTYPDMQLLLGAEVYLGDDYLEQLERLTSQHFLEGTTYLLLEFSRQISFNTLQQRLHEVRVKGYMPLIAHVEMYKCLTKDLSRVESLYLEGTAMQVSAQTLTGDNGKSLQKFAQQAIEAGYITCIASDAHNEAERCFALEKAFEWTTKTFGLSCAKTLFLDGPKRLLNNQPIIVESVRKSVRFNNGNRKISISFMSSVTICLILVASLMAFGDSKSDDAFDIATKQALKASKVTSIEKEEPIPTNTVAPTTVANKSSAEVTNPAVKVKSADVSKTEVQTASAEETTPTYESILAENYDQLQSLEEQYVSEVERYVSLIKTAKKTLDDKEERDRVINGYLDELVALEEISQNDVYAVLYDMQNTLEKYKYPVSEVEAYRTTYHETKAVYKSRYIEEVQRSS